MANTVADLSDKEKVKLFRDAATANYKEVGYENDLDEWYANDRSMANAIGRIVNDVIDHPGDYGVSEDEVRIVERAIEKRKVAAPSKQPKSYDKKKFEQLMNRPFDELILEGRKKAYALINKKMDNMLRSKSELDDTSLSQMTTSFGILFDKAQVLQGQATDHIAFQGEIKEDIDPDEAIEKVQNIREARVEKS